MGCKSVIDLHPTTRNRLRRLQEAAGIATGKPSGKVGVNTTIEALIEAAEPEDFGRCFPDIQDQLVARDDADAASGGGAQ